MTGDNFQIDSAAISDRGLNEKRLHNEDSFLELSERGIFAVADGVGGAQAGDVASQMAVEILGEAFSNLRADSDAEELMKIAISHANASIFQMSNDLPQLSTMATTIVALHVDGNVATIGHVGDSRLYRLDARGSLYRETQDHSVVEEEVRAGRMTAAQAATHPSRNVISRALGAEQTVEIDMKTIMFEPNATFLLCSDGITRHIDDFEIRELLLSNENPSTICERMKEICYERGAQDNLTAVVVKVGEAAAAVSADTNQASENEFEEATAAAARPPIVSNASISHSDAEGSEIPTQNLDRALLEKSETSMTPDDSAEYADNRTEVIPAAALAAATAAETGAEMSDGKIPADAPEIKREIVTVDSTEKPVGSLLGKLLSSILLLLVGVILGAGLYYLWLNQNTLQTQPPMPPMQSQNIPFTSFEQNRRNVDANPQQYIETNKLPPANAEEFYLLGRAYLLSDNPVEAKRNFIEAKNRLSQADGANSKVLASDIAAGLAIINAPFAQTEFRKELNPINANGNFQSNSNFNSFNSSP